MTHYSGPSEQAKQEVRDVLKKVSKQDTLHEILLAFGWELVSDKGDGFYRCPVCINPKRKIFEGQQAYLKKDVYVHYVLTGESIKIQMCPNYDPYYERKLAKYLEYHTGIKGHPYNEKQLRFRISKVNIKKPKLPK